MVLLHSFIALLITSANLIDEFWTIQKCNKNNISRLDPRLPEVSGKVALQLSVEVRFFCKTKVALCTIPATIMDGKNHLECNDVQ